MKNKTTPWRLCLGCWYLKPTRDLLRIRRPRLGELLLDDTGKKNGRGAYLCRDIQCFAKARKSKALERSFQMGIGQEIYERLEKEWERFEKE